jgi:hypothetical protein
LSNINKLFKFSKEQVKKREEGKMSFSALGSLCRRVCDYCAVRTLCDCSKNTIVLIGDTDLQTKQNVLKIFREANHDFVGAVSAGLGQQKEIQLLSSSLKQADEDDQILAIFAVAQKNLAELMREPTQLAEGWSRFNLACRLANVDLQDRLASRDKFRDLQPLTGKESEELKKQVDRIKLAGSAAVALWKLVCKNAAAWQTLKKIDGMSRAQLNFLRGQLKGKDKVSVTLEGKVEGDPCFDELSLQIQEIFLKAAEFSPPDALKKQPFEPWVLKAKDSPSTFGRSPSRVSHVSDEKEEKVS